MGPTSRSTSRTDCCCSAGRIDGWPDRPMGWLGLPVLLLVAAVAGPRRVALCTYQTFTWSATLKRSVLHETVRHPYAALSPEEIDRASGCTVCEEDQETIALAPLPPFRMCRRVAAGVRRALTGLLALGQPIREVVGYRVG